MGKSLYGSSGNGFTREYTPWASVVGLRLQLSQHLTQLFDVAGQQVSRGGVQDLKTDRPVAMDDAISQLGGLGRGLAQSMSGN